MIVHEDDNGRMTGYDPSIRTVVTDGPVAQHAVVAVGGGRDGRDRGPGAIGGALYWGRVLVRAQQATRDALIPMAADQIPKVFGYDYQTVERSLGDAANYLTPEYRREFEDRVNKDIIPQARDRQVVAQPTSSAWVCLMPNGIRVRCWCT